MSHTTPPVTPSTKTIIIDDAVPYAQAMFGHLGNVITVPGKDITAHTVQNADALIVRSRTQVNAELLQHSQVQFVGSTVVGLDHIDQAWLTQNNITFYSAQGCNANSVAEFVINALFELAQHNHFDLSQKTLGIIGVGHVGSLLHQKAQALGMTCLLNDPPRERALERSRENSREKAPLNSAQSTHLEFVDLNTALKADIISFHTPLTLRGVDATYHLLNQQRLAHINPQQIIVNAARGGIIDETAWVNTPTQANIIDCWENEPHINPALYQTAYLATPHIAGHSFEAKLAGSTMVYNALCQAWNIAPQTHWQTHLPPAPAVIHPKTTPSQTVQSVVQQVLSATHNVQHDDQAIRKNNITDTYNAYETYRRHYPVHHEWVKQRFTTTGNQQADNLLTLLGFTKL
ncbi:4-phosphoerythronate dehydrogenase [Thiomicrorhabdus aquaedulcis]|uniref:4-phosphoerythronate dehydrogenase n=1 Tax=Thiomicrorhabdus aquaedulcis TaxID=2211106 RepID=UPI000FDB25F3|nr:4-phosphoerythronate dehydrogenase [Thiomicrorhabdus aquaedulcis]